MYSQEKYLFCYVLDTTLCAENAMGIFCTVPPSKSISMVAIEFKCYSPGISLFWNLPVPFVECLSNTVLGPTPLSVCFSRSGIGPKNVHF